MKVKLSAILNAVPVLRELMRQKLPATQAFVLHLIITELDKHLTAYQTAVEGLLDKYARREGEAWSFRKEDGSEDTEAVQAFNREHQELVETEVEIPDRTLSLKALEQAGVQLSAEDIGKIFWLLSTQEEV